MVDPRLVEYVQKNLQEGYDINSIRDALLNQGYEPNLVQNIINTAISQKTPQTNQGTKQIPAPTKIEYGGFWIRFSAASWDSLILGIPVFILQFLLSFVILIVGFGPALYLPSLVMLVVIIYMDGTKGGTPGKLILGLRINNEKNEFIGIPKAILRYLGKIVSTLILGIGHLMIAWDKKHQGLHDKIAKSYVVKLPGVDRKALFVIGIIIGFLPALLMPFIALGSLAYFGVLSPAKFLPQKCVLEPGLICYDHKVTPTETYLVLGNGLGSEITISSLTIGDCSGTFSTEIAIGKQETFILKNCDNGKVQETFNEDIKLDYKKEGVDYTITAHGNLVTKVQ